MSGDIQHEMAEGIENTLCVWWFLLHRVIATKLMKKTLEIIVDLSLNTPL